MKTALVIGVIFSVIDILIFAIICLWVNHSKKSLEEKKEFYRKIFGTELKQTIIIKLIIFVVSLNWVVEYFIFTMVFYWGPNSWRTYELESSKIYYSGEIFEMSPRTTIIFDSGITSEEKQYIIVEYEEKVKVTDEAPFSIIFKALQIEYKTGRVEYHVTSVY